MANKAMDSACGSILDADKVEAEGKRQGLGSRMATASLVGALWGSRRLIATFLGICRGRSEA